MARRVALQETRLFFIPFALLFLDFFFHKNFIKIFKMTKSTNLIAILGK